LPDTPRRRKVWEVPPISCAPCLPGCAAVDVCPRRGRLCRAFVDTASSWTFERALVGSARVSEPRGTDEFADYVEEQARLLSRPEPGMRAKDGRLRTFVFR
jgi:hypothetical protein